MRSLDDVNRGARTAGLALAGVLAGVLGFVLLSWPQTRRQVQCEELAERARYSLGRLTRRLHEEPASFVGNLDRAAGDARDSLLAESREFLRLDIGDEALRGAPQALVGRFDALAAAAADLDGTPDARRRFDDERARFARAVQQIAAVCSP
jgi:hypothetical protein